MEYPLEDMQGKGNSLLPVFKAVGGVPGLQFQLTPGGGKSWIYRCAGKVNGKTKRRSLGLGSYLDRKTGNRTRFRPLGTTAANVCFDPEF